MDPSQIAHSLVNVVERDNGSRPGSYLARLIPAKRSELFRALIAGVQQMQAAGCQFTPDEMDLMGMGEQGEAEEHFTPYAGYPQANKALSDIFDPEREWVMQKRSALGGLVTAAPMDVENPGVSFADLRPFDKNDWNGFAGAQNFEDDGSEPMIGEIKVTGWPEEGWQGNGAALDEAVIIVDAAGVSINGMNGAVTNNRDVFGKSKEQLIQEAKQLMARQPINIQELLDEGWDAINMPTEPHEEPQVPIEASATDQQPDPAKAPQKPEPEPQKTAGPQALEHEILSDALFDLCHNFTSGQIDEQEFREGLNEQGINSDYDDLHNYDYATSGEPQQLRAAEELTALLMGTDNVDPLENAPGYREHSNRGEKHEASDHHTFVPHANQAENSSCKVCNKQYDDTAHMGAPVKTADNEQIYRELEEEGRQDRELHEDIDNAETASSTIAHLVNVLTDDSMTEESRLERVRDEVAAFLDNRTGSKTAGPLDVENPGAAFQADPANAKVNRVIADLATEMKNNSIHGDLDITTDEKAVEGIESAVRKMMASGFQFTTSAIKWICWPLSDEEMEGTPEEIAAQAEVAKKLRSVPGYAELDAWLNTYYGGTAL